MVFSSTIFLFLFLPWVLVASFVAPRSLRNAVLLVASLFFYAWGETFYVGVMIVSILSNYAFGRLIGRHGRTPAGRHALAWGVAVDVLLLSTFKYTNFLVENLNEALGWIGLDPLVVAPVHLPIGISFFTLQAISYLVDVYRGDASVQRNAVDLALYISLFPQLIAGPIVRYRQIDTQLADRRVTVDGFAVGVRRFVIGLGKKVLIANALDEATADIFALAPEELRTSVAWFGLVAYTLQVYYDFSGYSDMAIGLGHMLGFRFPENFDFPFISRSIREYWRRWHISLGTWFRDYLYVPMGGNRLEPWQTYRNLMVVFVLCGLWHGANWTFIVFGLYHGAFLVLERQRILRRLERAPAVLQYAYALPVWTLGIVLFRAVDIGHAWTWYRALFGLGPSAGAWRGIEVFTTPQLVLVLALAVVCAVPLHRVLRRRYERWLAEAPPVRRRLAAAAVGASSVVGLTGILLLCAVYLSASTHNPFIYFQF